jgi:pimeloyl-ACP methyl ester carboxylesterase
MPSLKLGSQELHYREQGTGGPPLVLVHGAGGSSLHFAELVALLGRERRVVALDLPGHGRSPAFATPPPSPELLERYRDLVAELAERLGLGRFVPVGHSMGGAVALHVALAYGDRLAGLVLVATSARLKVAPAIIEAIRDHFVDLPQLMAAVAYSPASDPQAVRAWAQQQLQAPQDVVLADFRACDCFDVRQHLSEGAVRNRTLVISAADDRLTPPRDQQRLVELIAGARLETVTRAGHFVLCERPEAVARLILDRI